MELQQLIAGYILFFENKQYLFLPGGRNKPNRIEYCLYSKQTLAM